ncbi:LacI family transcriptional regulator [Alkalihalobacillus alcalophilus ATCC 27647 = CGMCC 1.3604]|uniref:LacI family transcriptional regulator n=1 Tax=Alkalihalobacillus alcalophilus ATCC 27647 = CGMCC 1.3604 TaxID=1218173 RepID=A0A094WGU5_ALKAL|nr:LacI family DNA-binding transcriptional regulator [Alkalihalobacillus alcalophilus]KGA96006.1 LacI family transcriptional regulator [Alkalihalobacillus alcalophilus ATCC 27647 = CGMCC 1.3604]MED1562480.1 LacI family DNA-binding transcriptional regulator [Alkalihalobacillus alcalophilus]THG88898.1 LacI family transcriptional regulator [Alkalihalobacillus alcalophilus ATCC 27647 = CGMCC 1.3604]
MKPKISDVAKVAGVSPTTVSRVLNNRGYLSEKTKKLVYRAMEELDYVPNDLARSLYNQRSNLIGLIVPTTSNPFFGELAFHLENICDSKGFKVMICNSSNREDKEMKYWDMLSRNQVDGMIVVSYNRGVFNERKLSHPVVAIDHYLSEQIPVVGSDNYAGGKAATTLLLEKGCKEIIHLHGPTSLNTPANLRKKAYEDVMCKNGVRPITLEVNEILNKQNQQRVIEQLFNTYPNVEGIFASDDMLAASVIREARLRNIEIPNQLKVVGYDGTEALQTFLPQLTTVQQPIEQIAETAIMKLVEMIEEKDQSEVSYETRLPITIKMGETT